MRTGPDAAIAHGAGDDAAVGRTVRTRRVTQATSSMEDGALKLRRIEPGLRLGRGEETNSREQKQKPA